MAQVRLGLAQLNATVGDFAGNLDKFLFALEQGRQMSADLMVFPELFLCGYPPEDLLFMQYFLDENKRALKSAARACQGIEAVVGHVRQMRGRIYNSASWLGGGKVRGVYSKMKLPNYGVFDEPRYFTPGRQLTLFQLSGLRVGLTICEDIWVNPGPAERIADQGGAKLILNLSASPFHAGKYAEREQLITDLARRTKAWVVYTNLVGGQDELLFDGRSLAADPEGQVLLKGPHCKEKIMWLDIDETELKADQAECGKGCKLYPVEGIVLNDKPALAHEPAAVPGEVEEIYQALVLATGDYVSKNGFEKVVLGLSGGIDSSLTAAVAVDALGPDNVIGVTMPSRITSTETRSDAEATAANLGMRLLTVPIEPVLDSFTKALDPAMDHQPMTLARENLQARIRGNILMALSNQFGWLVLTTGNKSEVAVGYCTLYGDMAGGFSVIKDVPKTVVYKLSEYLNRNAGRELIPESVILRPPTAELRENQKDQDDIPDYDILDKVVLGYVEGDQGHADLIAQGFDKDLVDELFRRVDRNEYKRRQAAPGVKITPKAFGKDRRMPITVRFRPVKK